MSHNTVYSVQVSLQLHPEPCSSDTPGTPILIREVLLPITADLFLSVVNSGVVFFGDRSFKIDQLRSVSPYRLTCEGKGYLKFENHRDEAVMTDLIYSGWKVADPADARRHKYAIPEDLLVRFETLEEQPA